MSDRRDLLHLWLTGEPGISESDVQIEDTPGESDLVLVASAIARGELGRILPATLYVAESADPAPGKVRSIDVARLLRENRIRHRRRYEVLLDDIEVDDMT